MRYCEHCGAQLDENAVVCPSCGCQVRALKTEAEETPIYGILALVFGAFGGVMGLVFGLIGLKTYKNETYRKYCKIGIGLFIAWVIIAVIAVIIAIMVSLAASTALIISGSTAFLPV